MEVKVFDYGYNKIDFSRFSNNNCIFICRVSSDEDKDCKEPYSVFKYYHRIVVGGYRSEEIDTLLNKENAILFANALAGNSNDKYYEIHCAYCNKIVGGINDFDKNKIIITPNMCDCKKDNVDNDNFSIGDDVYYFENTHISPSLYKTEINKITYQHKSAVTKHNKDSTGDLLFRTEAEARQSIKLVSNNNE